MNRQRINAPILLPAAALALEGSSAAEAVLVPAAAAFAMEGMLVLLKEEEEAR